MSISLMTAAFKLEIPTTQKFVMVALCDSANDQGECYPSVQVVMSKCSLSERAVQGAIGALEAAGYVRREFRNGRSTVYWLSADPRTPCTPAVHAPPHVVHPTPARRAPPPPHVVHPTPARRAPITIIEPSVEPSGNQKKAQAQPKFPELDGIDPQVIADWKALRVAKRAPVTATAIAGIRREAEKAGMTLADALSMACERGWAGFKAEWIADRSSAAPSRRAPMNEDAIRAENARTTAAAREMLFGKKELIDA